MSDEEKSASGGKNNLIIAIALTVLIAGGAGFLGGMKFQESKTPEFLRNMPSDFESRRDQLGQRTGAAGFRPVSGEIISADEDSITVKLQDDSSKIILLTDSSNINKTEEGSKEDLAEGVNITAFGQENSDGSITAENIQVGSEMFRELK